MKKFWNGKEISEENLIELITECIENKWKNSDLLEETETACEIIALEEYEGKKEDVEYIIEKLDDGATLFDVENAIANGDWYFMETETWKIKEQEKNYLEKMIEKLKEKGKIELEDGSVVIKLSQAEFNFYNSIQKNNTGNYNSGNYNSGNRNVGNYNSGYFNTGDSNTGEHNYGDKNSGSYNIGSYNTGSYNIGNYNSGYHNVGSHNTGDSNTGSYNTGNYNDGNYNVGNFNVGDFNVGSFNTEKPKLRFFDKETDMTIEEWQKSEAFAILRKIDLRPVEWVWSEDPKYKTTGGYLEKTDVGRIYTDKPFLSWWNSLNEREKEVIKSIPNFDEDKFFKITGIRV